MMRTLFNFFAPKKIATTHPIPEHFTWDKQMIDEYGKPITLEELKDLQEFYREDLLERIEEAKENETPITLSPK
jgi:hypothetical protein